MSDSYSARFQKPSSALKYSERFETGARRFLHNQEQEAITRVFSQLKVSEVLDAPCGAGRFFETFSKMGIKVRGLDVSNEMIQIARNKNQFLENILSLDVADISKAENIPPCEAVFCNRLLHHLKSASERQAVLRSLFRCTQKYLVVSFFDYHLLGGLRNIFAFLKRGKSKSAGHPTYEEFQGELKRSGFTILEKWNVGAWWRSQKYLVCVKVS